MAARGQRRPLQQATLDNLRNTQAAHRQHLQAASRVGACAGAPALLLGNDAPPRQSQQRPPQLPGTSPQSSVSGAVSRFRSDAGDRSPTSAVAESPRGNGYGPAGAGSRAHHGIREARSFSAEAFGAVSPPSSPSAASTIAAASAGVASAAEKASSASVSSGSKGKRRAASGSRPGSSSSSRASPRAAASSVRSDQQRELDSSDFELPRWAAPSEADDEEAFAADLNDLEDLCRALNLRSEERQSTVDFEPRPPTGGTSASASTTAPGGSNGFEVASVDFDEPVAEALPESENPFDSLRGGQRASYELQQCGSLPHGCRIERTPGVSAQFFFSVDAAEGPYAPATLTFWIKIFNEFPALDGISIRSTKRIFHPHIHPDTGLLKLQREGCDAESRLKDILCAIRQAVLRPTDSPAVNADAAMLLQTDPEEFRRTVRSTLAGGEYSGARFDKVLDFSKKRGNADDSSEKRSQQQMSDQMKVQLMQLDVMQAKFKAFADRMITDNNLECRDLEVS